MEAFPCLYLCTDCGRLVDPPATDPNRSLPDAGPRACPACGETGLADLRHTPTATALCELEQDERRSRVGVLGWLAAAVVSAALVAAAVGLALGAVLDHEGHAGLRAALIVGPLALIAVPALLPVLRGLRPNQRRDRPRRWRMAGPAHGRTRRRGRGRVSGDETLRAPLSGRPCLAYEVAVRDDPRRRARLSTWRLVEQRNAALRVDDFTVEPDEAILEPRRSVTYAGSVASFPSRVRNYLRMRGFVETETVHVYETRLEAGAPCTLIARGGGSIVRP